MPSKNILKTYVEGDYYHVYNRGVEKRNIFLDERDFAMFRYLLIRHLDPNYRAGRNERQPVNLSRDVELIAFCLMGNHFHLLLHQLSERGIEKFGRSVYTAYAMYFNQRYDRVGGLFQDCYKAVRIESDAQLTHVVNYIHANPLGIGIDSGAYNYSSYGAYFGQWGAAWLRPLQGDFLQEASLKEVFLKDAESSPEATLLVLK